MPRVCSICTDERVRRIDLTVIGGGCSIRGIARRFGISDDALFRHAKTHIPEKLRQAAEADEVLDAGKLLRKIQALEGEARRLMRKAEARGDTRGAIAALRELARGFELCGKALVAVPPASLAPVRFSVDLSRDEDELPPPEPSRRPRLLPPAPDVLDVEIDEDGAVLI